jgi:hypothetical protein
MRAPVAIPVPAGILSGMSGGFGFWAGGRRVGEIDPAR